HTPTEFEIYDYYEKVKIFDFKYDKENDIFIYPCPCGDNFEFSMCDLENNEKIAYCPSCPLIVKVIYNEEDVIKLKEQYK
ncbi:DPH3 like protein, partial [Tubulinosema ratisbonensis]